MAHPRICLIGSGPSGMSVLYQLERLRNKGVDVPDVVCYEKQDNWGGLWNYTWRTGLDENGEAVHGSMYRYLWSNGPKEALEFPDYTFEEHFGKAIPSFPPREVLFDYLQGRWNKMDLKKRITFKTVVRSVRFIEDTEKFSVTVESLSEKKVLPEEEFDYVIVASGHYSTPFVPHYPGVERFPGRVMHSHDFRDAVEFEGKRLLMVGSSYSAEDIALQTVKYGAQQVICTYRNKPMGYKWPDKISERPIFTRVDGKVVYFSDGSTAEVDAIIFCTGYLHHYPFLEDKLRLRSSNHLYPPNLYKGTIFTPGGKNKMLYIGVQDQCYTYTMFDVQAFWVLKYIIGDVKIPDKDSMVADWKDWVDRNKKLEDGHGAVDFQTDYVMELVKESGYGHDLDISDIFHNWLHDKQHDILTYRDVSFTSKYTKTKSPVHHTTFMTAIDDSMKCFLSEQKGSNSSSNISMNEIKLEAIGNVDEEVYLVEQKDSDLSLDVSMNEIKLEAVGNEYEETKGHKVLLLDGMKWKGNNLQECSLNEQVEDVLVID